MNANHRKLSDRPFATAPGAGEVQTQQSFAESCNINTILARYQKTGVIDHVAKHGPEYGFVDGTDFTTQMQTIAKATSMFEELPSEARKHFNHDPAQFLDYVHDMDDEKFEQLAELGLIDPLDLTLRETVDVAEGTTAPPDTPPVAPPTEIPPPE